MNIKIQNIEFNVNDKIIQKRIEKLFDSIENITDFISVYLIEKYQNLDIVIDSFGKEKIENEINNILNMELVLYGINYNE